MATKDEAGPARRRDDLLGRAAAVGERRVDVDDAPDPHEAVVREGPRHGERPPEHDPQDAQQPGRRARAPRTRRRMGRAPRQPRRVYFFTKVRSASALSVFSQVNSGSLRPKWP